ncbi:TIGR03086 family metal-binding protein [Actinoplanes sp. L3-i22]|uniref:TIGR03086 family metal-binding protein n=1 Tax=Actinoplanes sp. L3-i22 TaxID=2836373 RepID=UPI001C769AE1|nr:TIGR03086 family metal-binding protein [Actinoplanes sp. L3-i22]BCY14080.1 TIGR03086 family protein [Actinoplanes sp. L3-i22]
MPTITEDLRPIHSTVIRATADLVGRATVADLTRPTPCAGWDLGDLLAHMTVQHLGFAAAARGHGADPAVWTPVRPGADFAERYAEAADAVIDAFAAPDALVREVHLPELSPDRTFPGRLALTFHLVDYVVHGWDVATALGLPFRPSPEALAATLPIARSVPGGAARLAPGAAFAPALPVPPDTDPLTEILLLLGRRP